MNSDAILQRLGKGPAVLFLGQRYLALDSGSDPLLAEILRKYPASASNLKGFFPVLESGIGEAGDSALAWIDERCKRLSPPEGLRLASGFAWSGVFSSAIDSIWPSCFRTAWRDLNLIFEEKYRPSDPRSKTNLHCVCLFGSVNRTDPGERPPLSRFDWMKRKQVAVGLARRIPEVLTPWGTLLIEGYDGTSDWFSNEDFLPIIDSLNPGQAHVFSTTDESASHPDIKALVKQGKLTLHRESLGQILAAAQEKGVIQLGSAPQDTGTGRRMFVKGRPAVLPREIWQQVSKSAVVLDDSALEPPAPLSEEARYREFRAFLSGTEGRPHWSAYARGFGFPREFQVALTKEIQGRLESKKLSDDPIILHGQSGVGKTVALGAVAYDFCKDQAHPVLFIERRTQRPVASDLDRFCKWAEDSGAQATLIVWDGMLESREYADLAGALAARGRKAVVVGSTYRLEGPTAKRSNHVLAPGQLSTAERKRFAEFLGSFHPSYSQLLEIQMDDTFLVALYRLLPPTRSQIRSGLIQEVGRAEDILTKRAVGHPGGAPEAPPSILAQAILAAGLAAKLPPISADETIVSTEAMTKVQRLTGLVMVPGRFGLSVPLEVILRALGREGYAGLPELFQGLDIFRWHDDSQGNIEIGPRNSLEAALIVSGRLGGAKMEVAFARDLLIEVRDSGSYSGDRELTFAVDLVRAMGVRGEQKSYFSPYFNELAGALRGLREERGFENPRLMLQEGNLSRQWAIERHRSNTIDDDTDAALAHAESVLQRALDLIGDDARRRDIRSQLLVEFATTIGTRAQQLLEHPTGKRDAVGLYRKARQSLAEARSLDPGNYYPTDVIAWLTQRLLESNQLADDEAAEAIADVLHVFELTDSEDIPTEQRERFNSRRLKFGEAFDLEDLADSAFDALVAQGSGAGYFLRALRISGLSTSPDLSLSETRQPIRKALQYLEENLEPASKDIRCLDLYLDLWWLANTGVKLFDRERLSAPLTEDAWKKCLDILATIERTGKSSRPLRLAFLRGLANFHVGSTAEAFATFREVNRESDRLRGRWRVIRSFVASSPDGTPRKFHGSVKWVDESGLRGEVYVEELRHAIPFLPRDFGRPEIAKGESLGEFHVAFNFLGPVADQVTAYKHSGQ